MGRLSQLRGNSYRLHHIMQPQKSLHAVHFLTSMLLRLDHQNALRRDAAVSLGQYARLHALGQTRGRNIKAQLNGA